MPAPLKVKLNAVVARELLQMKQTPEIPQRVRERAEMVRLNGYGWSVSQIAKYMKKCPHTVRDSLHRFKESETGGCGKQKGEEESQDGHKQTLNISNNVYHKSNAPIIASSYRTS
ncbi:MAG: helix-turn-helix domain-containing protein [Chroococcidiopsidaceae cyanobacterium CP_BM_RX_35]|nr:helix-turn-helix domain-containing protein [Chroococcidiopsidaceae cyanobacterium CP_BM_RX_35]